MNMPINAGILGLGMAVPDRILTNADFEKLVDTSDEWIVARTGIRERRVSDPNDLASSLGASAGMRALEDAGVSSDELDCIICATSTGDYIWPATACIIQRELGARKAAAFDVSAACTGFIYALSIGAAFIQTGAMRRVLVVGSDMLTRQVNWEDRATCILFGDGAGAAIIGPCNSDKGILSTALGADGGGSELIYLPAGGMKIPVTADAIEKRQNTIFMRGSEVFKFAVRIMGEVSLEALRKAELTSDDVSLFIPHQANLRIIKSAAEKMHLPADKVFVNVHKYGNTSAASVPIAMTEAVREGRVHHGDVLVTVAFGAGLTWGANVIRWSRND